ncbi:MAG: Hpt domain-containing protein [Bacteroidales bacterium]|jgi:HPt (histidine-containing phosphotransfer) domain-containing protein|nr:Hpt domain-containing protein [Bacteroidales bacterium]
MNQEYKLINISYLKSISNGNDPFILELIDLFFEQIPEYQNLLKHFYDSGDWNNLARIAHKAKSAILMVGMDKLAQELKKLEENAKVEKNIHEYQEIIANFVDQSNIAIHELKLIRNKII